MKFKPKLTRFLCYLLKLRVLLKARRKLLNTRHQF